MLVMLAEINTSFGKFYKIGSTKSDKYDDNPRSSPFFQALYHFNSKEIISVVHPNPISVVRRVLANVQKFPEAAQFLYLFDKPITGAKKNCFRCDNIDKVINIIKEDALVYLSYPSDENALPVIEYTRKRWYKKQVLMTKAEAVKRLSEPVKPKTILSVIPSEKGGYHAVVDIEIPEDALFHSSSITLDYLYSRVRVVNAIEGHFLAALNTLEEIFDSKVSLVSVTLTDDGFQLNWASNPYGVTLATIETDYDTYLELKKIKSLKELIEEIDNLR